MKQMCVNGREFKEYGRVIGGYDLTELLRRMEATPLPDDVVYVASDPDLEGTEAAGQLTDGIYGQMPIQAGYCNGHNRKLNALEYHRDSEVDIAVTDLVLLLGRQQDIGEDGTYDTSLVKAFFVPAGTAVEIYGTTLHYAPCQASEAGFRCVIILPRGTNGELKGRPPVRCGEERMLAAVNKWLIGHPEGGLPEGSWLGLRGENVAI